MVLFFVNKKEWISKKENTNKIANVSQQPLDNNALVAPTVDAVM